MKANCENDGLDTTAQVGTAHGGAGLSDAGPGPSGQDGLLPGFLGQRGASIVPLDGLRGPADGPAAALSHGDSTLVAVPVAFLGQRGGPGGLPGVSGGPRAAAVLAAVGEYLRRGKASPGRAKRRGRRGGRCGPQTVKCAPDSAPLFKEPAFSAPQAGCSSRTGTTAASRGAQ
jgi:hypothetical protein